MRATKGEQKTNQKGVATTQTGESPTEAFPEGPVKKGSRSAYARHRGVHPSVVHYAVSNGKITMGEDGLIDFAQADEQWALNTRPYNHLQPFDQDQVPGGGKKKRKTMIPGNTRHGTAWPDGVPSLALSQAKAANFKAKIAELEYEKAMERLVDAKAARDQLFALARAARDELMNIPDRIAPVLAAETDQFVIHQRLTKELQNVCSEIAQKAGKDPGGMGGGMDGSSPVDDQ